MKNNNDFNIIVNSIMETIKSNKNVFEKLIQEDEQVSDFEFDFYKLVDLIAGFKDKSITCQKDKKILINHYGNPYITAMLCLEAVRHNLEIIIGIEDRCYGVNWGIVKIMNDALGEYSFPQILLKNNLKKTEVEELDVNEVICLGNSNSYMRFRDIKNVEVKNVPLFDLSLYYDSEEYETLAKSIRTVSDKNYYEIEIFDETEDIEEVIYSINHGLKKYCAVLLSKDLQKQKRFKEAVNAEVVAINENPFKMFKLEIPEKIWE